MNKKLEIILVTLLYLAVFFVWTLPVSEIPFGDVDATTHYGLSSYMAEQNKVIYELPYHLNFTYGFASNGKLWYPPQFHLDAALMQLVGNDVVQFYLLMALFSSVAVLTSFLLIRHLFGFWPAFLSSLLLGFSARDYLTYLFAQWPQALSYAMIPLTLYCFYRYTELAAEDKARPWYMYVMAALLAIQFYFHPQGLLHSSAAIALFSVYLFAKEKKIFFAWKDVIIAVIILAVLAAPFVHFPLNLVKTSVGTEAKGLSLGRLFMWYPDSNDPVVKDQYPDAFYSYKDMHGVWTLPLLLLGIIVLGLKRTKKEWFMLTWLISFYILTHLDVIGFGGRIARSLQAETAIIYPIIVLGLLSIPNLVKLNENIKRYITAGLVILFLVFAFFYNIAPAYNSLKNPRTFSVNPSQYEASLWIKQNLPDSAMVFDVGTMGLAYVKWMRQLSHRAIVYPDEKFKADYYLLDYTHGQQAQVGIIEQGINATPLYDKNAIKVYKVETGQ